MDPLTHAVSGAVLARALPARPLPARKLALLMLLAMAPDADIALEALSDVAYLQYHRGVTHSLLMLPLWVWLLHALIRRCAGGVPPWLIAAAIALHILLDLITSFGTMILAPVSDWRATLDLVFIVDPLFTLCFLLPLLLSALWKRHARTLAMLSLALAAGYIALAAWNHHRAISLARACLPEGATALAALPLPFSPFHWQVIANTKNSYARAMIDLAPNWPDTGRLFPAAFTRRFIAPAATPRWQTFRKMSPDITTPGADFYRWFARYPVMLGMRAPDTRHIGDLRFGIYRREAEWPFRLMMKNSAAWLIWRDGKRTLLE